MAVNKITLISLRNIPGVDIILNSSEIKKLIPGRNIEIIKYAIRSVINQIKENAIKGTSIPDQSMIIQNVIDELNNFESGNLKRVYNATGIVAHTNLGRAPFGEEFLNQATESLKGYNNLEFDLKEAKRGSRNTHLSEILKFLTGAEDVLIVNNNAAAVLLILRTFAKNKNVIVSRGELIEIGGSFRLPDILASSDCKMVEVGTTNKTKLSDYKNSITRDTAILFKAHKSNYSIQGFTHEVSLNELVELGRKHNIPVVYDMGSGLINKEVFSHFIDEPDVRKTLSSGIDLICFSGDKLMGGPQAGIIAGKKKLIAKLKKEPMLRALRVDKITLAFLETVCRYFINEDELFQKNLFYKTLAQKQKDLKSKANSLQLLLKDRNIISEVTENKGQFGGGTLPGSEINSYAVKIRKENLSNKQKSLFAEKMFNGLLHDKNPLLGILKKGHIYFDVLTLEENELEKIADIIHDVHESLIK